MTPEIHAVILWSTALAHADEIVADMRSRFELVGSYRVEWTPARFAENLRRLYGFALPERIDKSVGSGTDPFLLFVIRDPAPVYAPRLRSSGIGVANVATYDAKARYRDWAGGGFRVHTTIDREEAERDLHLLLGRRASRFVGAPAVDWRREPDVLRADVLGADGWSSRDELLTALELTTGYVLLDDPEPVLVGAERWARDLIGRGEPLQLRALDDGSLDPAWQRAILREAARDDAGRLVATPEHRLYVRLYEVVAHCEQVPAAELRGLALEAGAPDGDYGDAGFAQAMLEAFLRRNGWKYVLPRDPNAPRNPLVLGRRARLRRVAEKRVPSLVALGPRIRRRAVWRRG